MPCRFDGHTAQRHCFTHWFCVCFSSFRKCLRCSCRVFRPVSSHQPGVVVDVSQPDRERRVVYLLGDLLRASLVSWSKENVAINRRSLCGVLNRNAAALPVKHSVGGDDRVHVLPVHSAVEMPQLVFVSGPLCHAQLRVSRSPTPEVLA